MAPCGHHGTILISKMYLLLLLLLLLLYAVTGRFASGVLVAVRGDRKLGLGGRRCVILVRLWIPTVHVTLPELE